MSTVLAQLQDTATKQLRSAMVANDVDRTAHFRAVAEAYVDARALFYTKDGAPDWTGKTYAYRNWVREVTGGANIPASMRTTVQAAVRYHIGNVLRERLAPDELAAVGLRAVSPRERSVEKREGTSAALNMLNGGAPLDQLVDITTAAATFTRALRRVDTSGLTKEERVVAAEALTALADEALRRAAGAV